MNRFVEGLDVHDDLDLQQTTDGGSELFQVHLYVLKSRLCPTYRRQAKMGHQTLALSLRGCCFRQEAKGSTANISLLNGSKHNQTEEESWTSVHGEEENILKGLNELVLAGKCVKTATDDFS